MSTNFKKTLATLVLVAVASFGAAAPKSAKADTISDLQAQISALMAQISALSGVSSNCAATYNHTVTLKQGSKGSQVAAMQAVLGVTADGNFGPMTKASLMSFQANHGLTADGVDGPMTGAALHSSSMTGCTSTGTGSTSTTSGSLQGGAADIDVNQKSSDIEDTINEDEQDVAVLGFEVKPTGGDVNVTSVKVKLQNDDTASSSDRLNRYIDEATLWYGNTKVGSLDVDDFTRDSTDDDIVSGSNSNDVYTGTISVSNSVVREGDKGMFRVALSANSSIDDDDLDANFNIVLDSVRFNDSTGAILINSVDSVDENFGFDDSSANNDLTLKSSSNNPDDQVVKVDEHNNTDDVLALSAKLDNDNDSPDADILDIPVKITVDSGDNTIANVDDVIDTVTVRIDGDDFDADVVGNGDMTATSTVFTYKLDLDNGDVTIDSGDTVDVEVFITFNKQDTTNYSDNTVVTASINPNDIDAESDTDDMDVGGSTRTGADLTLNLAAADLTNVSWSVPSAGTLIDFIFTINNDGDEDFDLLTASITANDGITGTATTTLFDSLTKISGDADVIGGGYTVNSGDQARFRARYTVTGANGTYANVTIPSVGGQPVDDDDQLSPTATVNVNS